jgi:predicted DCC family thiol-disulfide oxidoreductase YuxK
MTSTPDHPPGHPPEHPPEHLDVAAIAETGPLVLFDGVCNLCSWSVQFLAPRERAGRLWYASVQSEIGRRILIGRGLPTEDYDSFVFLDGGRAYFKSAAVLRVVRHMRFPWPLLWVGALIPHQAADWLYDRVARNRYAVFGRKPVCMIPCADIRARFLG